MLYFFLYDLIIGHNTDGKFFLTTTKLSFHYETSPKRIVLYIEKTKDGHVTPVDVQEIVDFSCGPNHTVILFLYLKN